MPKGSIPNNLPRSSVGTFIGREDKLAELDRQLQNCDHIAITALKGMGGIGKTELALQYAIRAYRQECYPGGVCWLRSRGEEIATQIVSFARVNLGLTIPDDIEADEQVKFIWQRWPEGNAFIVIDDVVEYSEIAPYLPPSNPRFKVLMTTRKQNLAATVTSIDIEELSNEDAITLLKSLVGENRIESQLSDAQALCEWVGNLPLGLELTGRFLQAKPDWAVAKLLESLDSKRLAARALIESKEGMTASLGVAAALELSWTELDGQQQNLACLLGMFAVAPIPWNLVEQCFEDTDPDDLEDWRDEGLRDRSLLKRVGEGQYQLHQIVQEFFRAKLNQKGDEAIAIKTAFGRVMVAQAKILDPSTTLKQIERVQGAIAHLEEMANHWLLILDEEEMIWPFVGIGRFYEGQGNYSLAEPWYLKSRIELEKALGDKHPDVASSLNNLALLYHDQGRYEEAEPLFQQSLAITQKVLGQEHPSAATSLSHLANLYRDQGRYEEAEPLFQQSLAIRQKMLDQEHPDVASSLNNLAGFYRAQGRYKEAEPLYQQSLAITQKVLGQEHPSAATSLNNLAGLYRAQGRYKEAEPLFQQSLAIRQKVLDQEHPGVANSLNNLALLYHDQGRYEEAEPLFQQSLAITQKVLGQEHPSVASSLNNLALLYHAQGRYEEAEPLFQQSLAITQKVLDQEHPDVANSLNNLATLYFNQGRYEEAEPLYQQALNMSQQLLGNNHPDVASSLNNLAGLYDNQGRYEEAEPLYCRAVLILAQRLGETHPNTQTVFSNFIQCLSQALESGQVEHLSDHPLTQHILSQLRSEAEPS